MRSGASAEGHKMDAIQGARIVVATGSPSVAAIDNRISTRSKRKMKSGSLGATKALLVLRGRLYRTGVLGGYRLLVIPFGHL